MPLGLKGYQQEGDDHFITFSCYNRKPYLNNAPEPLASTLSTKKTGREYRMCIRLRFLGTGARQRTYSYADAADYAPDARGHHALPDSNRSLVKPPLLVRLQTLSLLLRSLPVSVWVIHSVRSILAGAIPRILVWLPR